MNTKESSGSLNRFVIALIVLVVAMLCFNYFTGRNPDDVTESRVTTRDESEKSESSSMTNQDRADATGDAGADRRSEWNNGVITGRISSWPDDDPVTGVMVALYRESDLKLEDRIQFVESDDKGYYKLTKVPAGNYLITANGSASLPGFGVEEAWISLNRFHPIQTQDFLLKTSCRVFGTVKFRDGQPAAGETVLAGGYTDWSCRTTVNSDGSFELENVSPGRGMKAGVLLSDKISIINKLPDLGAGEEYGPVNLVIPITNKFKGIVRSLNNSEPISNVDIILTVDAEDMFGQEQLTTDAQGIFTIERMPALLGFIRFEHPRFKDYEDNLRYIPGSTPDMMEFWLEELADWSISGQLFTEKKTPKEGVQVFLNRQTRTRDRFGQLTDDLPMTVTNDHGDFYFEGGNQKIVSLIFMEDDRRLSVTPEFYKAQYKPGKHYFQEFTVVEPDLKLNMSGRVLDLDQNPVPGAMLKIISFRDKLQNETSGIETEPLASAVSDENGEYKIDQSLVVWSTLTVKVHKEGLGEVQEDLTLPVSGEKEITKDFVLGEDTYISGSVVDTNGIPVAGAKVKIVGGMNPPGTTSTTDAKGNFEISGLTSGTYDVMATMILPPAGAQKVQGVEAPEDDLEIVLGYEGEFTVSVRDKNSGNPVESYVLFYMVTNPIDRKPIDANMMFVNSFDGTATFRNVAYGELKVEIKKDPMNSLAEKTFDFNENNLPLTMEFEVDSEMTLEGYVYQNDDKLPFTEAAIRITQSKGGMPGTGSPRTNMLFGMTDEEGYFSIAGVMDGKALIRITNEKGDLDHVERVLLTQDRKPIEIYLDRSAPFYGRIVCSDTGKVPRRSVVSLIGPHVVKTFEGGNFHFDSIPAESSGIRVGALGYGFVILKNIDWEQHQIPEDELVIEIDPIVVE